jgi:hypothetical protein
LNDPEPKEYWVEWIVFGDGGMFGTDQPQDMPEPEFIIDDTFAEEDAYPEEEVPPEEEVRPVEDVLPEEIIPETEHHEQEIISDTVAVELHTEDIQDTAVRSNFIRRISRIRLLSPPFITMNRPGTIPNIT